MMLVFLLVSFISSAFSSPLAEKMSSTLTEETELLPANSNLTDCRTQELCNHGECILTNNIISCKCFKPFVYHHGEPCKEEGKSKLAAFLLSFFAGGFGAEWFYLSGGDSSFIIIGMLKIFITTIIPFLCFCCWMCGFIGAMMLDDEDAGGVCAGIGLFCLVPLVGILMLAGFIWWMVDWIRIVSGSWEVDGVGVMLYQDM